MAVRHGYGKIAGTDALIFAYDTGDTINSYRGRPTTNQFPIVGTVGEGAAADNTALFPTRGTNNMKRLGYGQTFGGYTIKPSDAVYKFDAVTDYVCAYHGGSATIPVGAYAVFRFEFLVSSTVTIDTGYLANFENYGNGAFSASPSSIDNSIERNVWHEVVFTAGPKTTNAGTQAMFLYPGGCSGTRFSSTEGYILYKNPMVEFILNTTPSQWTAGTRSATQGLLDLTRNSTIDLSNVSFDSNAQMTFDGTDDFIHTGYTRQTLGDTLTLSAWYRYTGNSSRGYTPIFGGLDPTGGTEFFIGKNTGNTNIGVQDGNYRGTFVIGSNAFDGNYHQIVYTYENGTGKIYLDGVLKSTGTFTKCNDAEQILIGRENESSGYYFIGDIPLAKIYNRALTPAEVQSNYRHYKKRFNI